MSKEATARSAISTERAMKLALEALEAATRYGAGGFEDAKDALREALVEQPAPVAKPHERKPLTDEEIEAAFFATKTEVDNGVGNFRDGVRFAEAAHGIKENT